MLSDIIEELLPVNSELESVLISEDKSVELNNVLSVDPDTVLSVEPDSVTSVLSVKSDAVE
mgnify:CR=1 FL=1